MARHTASHLSRTSSATMTIMRRECPRSANIPGGKSYSEVVAEYNQRQLQYQKEDAQKEHHLRFLLARWRQSSHAEDIAAWGAFVALSKKGDAATKGAVDLSRKAIIAYEEKIAGSRRAAAYTRMYAEIMHDNQIYKKTLEWLAPVEGARQKIDAAAAAVLKMLGKGEGAEGCPSALI